VIHAFTRMPFAPPTEKATMIKQSRADWEYDIARELVVMIDVDHSDATGIMDAAPFEVAQAWARGDDAETAARTIAALGETV